MRPPAILSTALQGETSSRRLQSMNPAGAHYRCGDPWQGQPKVPPPNALVTNTGPVDGIGFACLTGRMLDRRALLVLGLGSLVGCASLPEPIASRLARARSAEGGERALAAVKELAWTADAVVYAGDRRIEIGAETVVRPSSYARSTSWPKVQGRASARTILIDGAQGWLDGPSGRTALPPAQASHERLQFALYALMLLPAAASVELAPADAGGAPGLRLSHRDAPTTDFFFDPDGRLVAARNQVPDPDTGARQIQQDIRFSGVIESHGVRWPQQLSIRQNGQPYFDLALLSFEARDRAAG
jgi:hypothetical protein